jgi:hypothetical protein
VTNIDVILIETTLKLRRVQHYSCNYCKVMRTHRISKWEQMCEQKDDVDKRRTKSRTTRRTTI